MKKFFLILALGCPASSSMTEARAGGKPCANRPVGKHCKPVIARTTCRVVAAPRPVCAKANGPVSVKRHSRAVFVPSAPVYTMTTANMPLYTKPVVPGVSKPAPQILLNGGSQQSQSIRTAGRPGPSATVGQVTQQGQATRQGGLQGQQKQATQPGVQQGQTTQQGKATQQRRQEGAQEGGQQGGQQKQETRQGGQQGQQTTQGGNASK